MQQTINFELNAMNSPQLIFTLLSYRFSQMLLKIAKNSYRSLKYARRSTMNFGSIIISKSTPITYEDWEYCKLITTQLNNNNFNQAIAYLFQSYLSNQILDIQIYNQLLEKANSLSLPLSYAEITYQIYREHFPPNGLMKSWMHRLTTSKNEQFLSKLRKDYILLGEPYPVRKCGRQQSRREPKRQQNLTKSNEKISQMKSFKKYIQSQTQQFSDVFNHNFEPEELFRIKLESQLKEILIQLNINMCDHTNIDIKGVSVQFWNHESEESEDKNFELPSDEQYEFQEHPIDPKLYAGLFGQDINKITIKRLEFLNKNKV